MIDQERIELQEAKYREFTLRFLDRFFQDSSYVSCPISYSVDLFYTGINGDVRTDYVIEIKQRNCNYSDYPNAILTIDKLCNIENIATLRNAIPLYIVFYNDCIVVFNLQKLDFYKFTKTFLRVPSVAYSDLPYVMKEVFLIPLDLGFRFSY